MIGYFRYLILNIKKVIFLVVLYGGLTFMVSLPYINLIKIFISFLPPLVTWIVFILLFKPSKELLLRLSIALLLLGALVTILKIQFLYEVIGNIVYFMLATYVCLSFGEIKKRD